jgi:arylsulfatase A-like enzyme
MTFRISVRFGLGVFLVVAASTAAIAAGATPPNVIILITDDQGYADLGCHGNPVVHTPHLDRLHGESVRFTQFHASPMCTPTRGQLMTGIDALRNGAMNVSSGRTLLRREFPTIAELLRQAGYATGQFGKWHLGDNHPFRPQDRGFERAVWYPSSHIGSVPDHWKNDYFDDIYRTEHGNRTLPGYTTEAVFGEAMSWIKEQSRAGKPFFCYLATATAHSPDYVPKSFRDAVAARLEKVKATLPQPIPARLVRFLAMIETIDESFGRLESFLQTNGLRENTIVMFLTDNGSTMGPDYYNAGMKGRKVTLWEGGHRVPLFVRWPAGQLGHPRDVRELTQVQDIVPTLLELCNVQPLSRPRFDGISLAPLLRSRGTPLPERMLFINYSRMPGRAPVASSESLSIPRKDGAAVLWQKWRFLENRALYDIEADPGQERDVADQHPEIVGRLRKGLDDWWDGLKERVNEPQRVIIGSDAENPMMLTACEWWDVFVDQQGQVRRGEAKNGVWHLEVAKAGTYQIEIRRWPREAGLALPAAPPAEPVTDGNLPPGKALPIAGARIEIQGVTQRATATPDQPGVVFRIPLQAGPVEMQTWFLRSDGTEICGAYYVYIKVL